MDRIASLDKRKKPKRIPPRGLRALIYALAAGAIWVSILPGAGRSSPPAAPAPRSETPIREVLLSDGSRRYTVAITVGSAKIEAGLDTGSVGLRVLQRALAAGDVSSTSQGDHYAYGSGTRLEGVVGDASLTLGGLSGPAQLQVVKAVGCVPRLPNCPASRVSASEYGIQGYGLPGEGFGAILGVNMGKAEVANPLIALGARRWIVELPRPGENTPGRLIINPTDAETAGFVLSPLAPPEQNGGLHDAVPGCLINDDTKAKACGRLIMDTGAPGISVVNGDLGSTPWAGGTRATLAMVDNTGRPLAAERLTIGRRADASHLMFKSEPNRPRSVILAGLSPYFAYQVLYDPARGVIGLKPRPPRVGGPQAVTN